MRIQTLTISLVALAAAAHAAPASLATAFKDDFLLQLDGVEKKLLDLAEATPQDKFGYRPDPVARTTAEVFLHQAKSMYFIARIAGVKAPEGIGDDFEKSTTEKPKVEAEVKRAFAHVREAVKKMSDADLMRPVKLGGQDRTVMGVLFFMATHLHEHLGQSIAYARASGVTPPWSKGKE